MIDAQNVHAVLTRHQLADGMEQVLDLERSHGVWLHDARTGDEYLDAFTCFASWPAGFNHPRLTEPGFLADLARVAASNPSNSDLYTREMAAFVEAFATHVTPAGFPHHFWISGGGLAVENGLKVAFDWKARKLGRGPTDSADDLVILHFREAFHGRTGYTMSITNTDPLKVALFPKFKWPRVHNPHIEYDLDGDIANDIEASEARTRAEIEAAFAEYGDRIAGIIIEPLQGEGGDNHFRPALFEMLRRFADEREALLIYDEVQTGFFGSGRPWLWQHHGVAPDVVVFGKKSQVCGIYASARIDEVDDNVFALSSRINSTWGGSLTDMVRSRRLIEIITEEKLADNIAARGDEFVAGLRGLARESGAFTNVRGIGSLVAFTLDTPAGRDAFIGRLEQARVLALKSGPQAIRFRLPLIISAEEVELLLKRIADCVA